MERPFQPRTNIPPQPRFQNPARTILPERKVDSSLIDKLFLLFQKGNITEINDFILANDLNTNVINENGESLLHLVLKNDTMSAKTKYDICLFLEGHGGLSANYDKNNVTPLHLASRYQLKNIIPLLLKYKHDPNALDSNYKSPLHYAVTGNKTQCPPLKSRAKELIPIQKTKQIEAGNMDDINKLMTQISGHLIDVFTSDKTINRFMQYISNSFNNANDIFIDDFTRLRDTYKQDLLTILFDAKLEQPVRNEKIKTMIQKYRESIMNTMFSSTKTILEPIKLTPNLPTGWGPDNNQYNRILEVADLNSFKEAFGTDRQDYQSTMLNIKAVGGRIAGELERLFSYINNCEQTLNHIIVYNQALRENVDNNRDDIHAITDAELVAIYRDDLVQLITQSYELENNNAIEWTNDMPQVINNRLHIRVNFGDLLYNSLKAPRIAEINRPRLTKAQIAELRTNHQQFNAQIPIRNFRRFIDMNDVIGPNPREFGVILDIPAIPNYEFMYFTRRMKYYVNLLLSRMSWMMRWINMIDTQLARGDTNNVYSVLIPKIALILGNCISHNILLRDIVIQMTTKIDRLNVKFRTINQSMQGNPFEFLSEQASDEISELLKRTTELKIENLYTFCLQMFSALNTLIEKINLRNSNNFIIAYHNGLITYDNTIVQNDTDQIVNLFNRRLLGLYKDNKPFDEFIRTLPADHITKKRTLIERFIPQLNLRHYPSYYTVGVVNDSNPRIGFLILNPYDDNVIHVDLNRLYDGDLPNIQYGNTGDEHIRDTNAQLQGELGIRIPVQFNKNTVGIQLIPDAFADNLRIIKYTIVRYLLTILFGRLMDNADDSELTQIVKNLDRSIRRNIKINDEDKSLVLSMLGKLVDQIFTSNVMNFIISSSNNFGIDIVPINDIPVNFHNAYLQLMQQIPIIKPTIKRDINFTQISQHVLDNYFSTLKRTKINLMVAPSDALYDVPQKDNMFVKYGMNMTTLDDRTCFTTDIDIINLLLNAGANTNIRDRNGRTPIYDAVYAGNKLAVEILLARTDNGPSVYKLIDMNGINVVTFSMEMMNQYFGIIDYANIKSITKDVNEELKQKTDFKSVMRYNNIILPLAVYLLNHQLYNVSKEYPRLWTRQESQQLERLIGGLTTPFPFLSVYRQETPLGGVETVEKKIQSDAKTIEAIDNEILTMRTSLQNLMGELRDLINQARVGPAQEHVTYRINQLRTIINRLNGDIDQQQQMRDNMEYNKDTMKNDRDTIIQDNMNIFNRIRRGKLKLTEDKITLVYDEIEKLLNNRDISDIRYDIKSYPTLWSNYLDNDNSMIDGTQIITNTNRLLSHIIAQKNITNANNSVNLCYDLYNNVLVKFANDYFELPEEYKSSNYALDNIMEIIIHCMKHTIFVNLYHIIVKLITDYITKILENTPTDDMPKLIYQTLKGVLRFGYMDDHGHMDNLMTFVVNTIPERIAKVNLKIFENDTDPDRDTKVTTMTFLQQIINRIVANTAFPMPEDSPVVKDLKDHVLPYFKDYIEIFVKKLRDLLEGYLKMIINQKNSLEITKLILAKAIREKQLFL